MSEAAVQGSQYLEVGQHVKDEQGQTDDVHRFEKGEHAELGQIEVGAVSAAEEGDAEAAEQRHPLRNEKAKEYGPDPRDSLVLA